ncbi:MAG TPA: hypothetical protein DF984_07010 [Anaerolineaceae bacterium]|jgi:hypothetical protein|nr:hypothetical protein [Anaerolineaceae bacterium]
MAEKAILPYKAINVYMEQEYLESVLASVVVGARKLPKQDQIFFSQFLKKYVSVLGFRDPGRAPLSLQVKALAKAFEEKDEVVPVVLSFWTKVNKKLVKPVKTWLEAEGFKDLVSERDFKEGAGFIADWPKKMAFDKMVKKFTKDNTEVKINQDDLILMALWLTGQLPSD